MDLSRPLAALVPSSHGRVQGPAVPGGFDVTVEHAHGPACRH